MPRQQSEPKKVVRCAIYTRKSTDEGLEKEFNTLDAQREAGKAYIESQKNEGWVCLPDRYDDGGFTGGNMERPALQRLLEDVKAGKVQVILVYKIDRLSRSLADFVRIIEILEDHNATFVSVTQHFSTNDSMGRLTLNILLSFSQFEREIISERTRDKIAASRRRGKWTGGMPVLGYDIDPTSGRLVINEAEVVQVRRIFDLYLEHRSLRHTVRVLDSLGWTSKTWMTKAGHLHQGIPFNKQRLSKFLQNVTYAGKIRYKDEIHEGEHEAIIDRDTWNEVQSQLHRGDRIPDQPRNKYQALLRGLLHCTTCDAPMIHLPITKKGRKVYRYYVCTNAHNNGWDQCPCPSIPADEIELFVIERIHEIGSDGAVLDRVVNAAQQLWLEHTDGLRRELRTLKNRLKLVAASRRERDQQEARSLKARIESMEQRIALAEGHHVTAQECEDGLGQFEALWEILAIDERTHLLSLIFERIGFDGRSGKIQLTWNHPEIRQAVA